MAEAEILMAEAEIRLAEAEIRLAEAEILLAEAEILLAETWVCRRRQTSWRRCRRRGGHGGRQPAAPSESRSAAHRPTSQLPRGAARASADRHS